MAVKQVSLHPEAGSDNLREVQALEAEIALLKNMHHEVSFFLCFFFYFFFLLILGAGSAL
jgi:hypothetical protein